MNSWRFGFQVPVHVVDVAGIAAVLTCDAAHLAKDLVLRGGGRQKREDQVDRFGASPCFSDAPGRGLVQEC